MSEQSLRHGQKSVNNNESGRHWLTYDLIPHFCFRIQKSWSERRSNSSAVVIERKTSNVVRSAWL